MKIQVHHNEVSPLVKEGYEKVYDAMKKLLAPEEFIFAEWKAGFGDMLQWTLPADEQWFQLSQADVFDRDAVIAEFIRLRDLGASKLGKNKTLINNVYSVPSESFVYYTVLPSGDYKVMLAGWGYTYPRQMPMVPIIGSVDPAAQPVTLRFLNAGQPVSSLDFDIPRPGNRMVHLKTDQSGECALGSLMPGTSLSVIVPSVNLQYQVGVVKDKEYYTIDLTPAPEVKIPEIVTPPVVVTPPIKKPEPVIEEIIARNRDISIRFLSTDGQPITAFETEFSQNGRPSIVESIDNNGFVYLDKNDFAVNVPLKVELKGETEYPETTFTLDERETQYEIMFREKKKSTFWAEALCWLIAAGLACGAVYVACTIADKTL